MKTWLTIGVLGLACVACASSDDRDVKERECDDPPTESQTDLMDLKGALDWVSFVPDSERQYPEYYQELDKPLRRFRYLAPRSGGPQVVIDFDWPKGTVIDEVNWYGKTALAVEHQGNKNFTVALAVNSSRLFRDIEGEDSPVAKVIDGLIRISPQNARDRVADARAKYNNGEITVVDGLTVVETDGKEFNRYAYSVQSLGEDLLLIVEWRGKDKVINNQAMKNVATRGFVTRNIWREGSPLHKCHSSVKQLDAGVLAFDDARLEISLPKGAIARKTGGDSTVIIDRGLARPWVVLRLLDTFDGEGNLRARIRKDSVFRRYLDMVDGEFTAGERVGPCVLFGFKTRTRDQIALGVLQAGEQFFAVEIVSAGETKSVARKLLLDEARNMLSTLTATEPSDDRLSVLEGYNPGTNSDE